MTTTNIQQERTKKKSIEATERHLGNIKRLQKGKVSKQELSEMYSYLETCWNCGKPITIWDRLTFNCQHSFKGDSHRRRCR